MKLHDIDSAHSEQITFFEVMMKTMYEHPCRTDEVRNVEKLMI